MLNKFSQWAFCSVAALLVSSSFANAVGSVITGGGNAVNGGTISLSADTAGSTSDGFIVIYTYMDANKSYACTALTAHPGQTTSIDNVVTGESGAIDNTANAVALRGNVTPQVISNMTSPNTNTDDRIVITPITSGWYFFVVRNGSDINTADLKFECMETTLYGGYNTNANPYNFLELSNTTNATIGGSVKGYNFDGTATIDTSFTINANSRFDINLHDAAGANKYGMIIVTHDGPYGALQGAVSQYSGPVTALELRSTVPLKSREQTF